MANKKGAALSRMDGFWGLANVQGLICVVSRLRLNLWEKPLHEHSKRLAFLQVKRYLQAINNLSNTAVLGSSTKGLPNLLLTKHDSKNQIMHV